MFVGACFVLSFDESTIPGSEMLHEMFHKGVFFFIGIIVPDGRDRAKKWLRSAIRSLAVLLCFSLSGDGVMFVAM